MATDILQTAASLVAQGRPCVLATVVAVEGRTPRDAGARLIWLPDHATDADADPLAPSSPAGAAPHDGRIIGTVGGGGMEHLVIDACRRAFAARASSLERLSLLQDADQCCGGRMDVFVEFLGPRGRVVIFGAGHVSAALAGLLRESSLELIIADDRPEWNSAARFPACRRLLDWSAGLRAALEHPADTCACVMTYDHDRDFDLLRAILDAGAAALPAYLGLIGSRSKRACFWGRLSAAGVPESLLQRVECPMGVGDLGKAPLEVAVSIAARILLEARRRAQPA